MAQRGESPGTGLPPVIVLTNRAQCSRASQIGDVVGGAVRGGARAVIVREKDLSRRERAVLARGCLEALEPVGGDLVVASDASLALEIGASGVHLAAGDPFPSDRVRPRLVGRSCHCATDVEQATAEGCDYVTLSPVFESASKPGYGPALGLGVLSAVCASSAIPVFALGGIALGSARRCMQVGAAGVAVMGLVGATALEAATTIEALVAEVGGAPRGVDGVVGRESVVVRGGPR